MSEEKKAAEQTAQAECEKKPAENAAEPKAPQEAAPEAAEQKQPEAAGENPGEQERSEFEKAQQALAKEHDSYLRLAAEYDNFRKRSQREKDNLYTEIRAETVEKFLPVYDNLERALKQETADEAFKKGVEMTMTQLTGILDKLGVTVFGEAGETFDPAEHNAVMHIEDESMGENTIVEVFQKGFRIGDRIIRFAMVKVAN